MRHLIFWVFQTLLLYNTAAKHVMKGHITYGGVIDTSEGPQPYWAETDVKMPLLPWEEICPDDCDNVKVKVCNERRIVLKGNVEEEDFAEGVVLSFPEDDYTAFGCAPPPLSEGPSSKPDEVIFRKIVSVNFQPGRVALVTEFILGGEVAPKIRVHFGEQGPTSTRIIGTRRQIIADQTLSLNTSTRVGTLGFTAFKRSGSIPLSTELGAKLDYSISLAAGICDFEFDRFPPKATWVQRLEATAMAAISARLQFSKEASGNIFDFPIPGLSFSKKIFLIGTIGARLSVKLSYTASATFAASASFKSTASYVVSQNVKVALTDVDVGKLEATKRLAFGAASANGTGAPNAQLNGYAGVRPVVAVTAVIPLLPDPYVDIGVDVGVRANMKGSTSAYKPVASGTTFGVCKDCHYVQGTLDFVGSRFSSNVDAPIVGKKEFVFANELFNTRLGTACFFATSCPALRIPVEGHSKKALQ